MLASGKRLYRYQERTESWLGSERTRYALTGGEDYELLFCARQRDRQLIDQLQNQIKAPVTRIGVCVPADQGISCLGSFRQTHFRYNDRS